ncbi:MAG: type IV pilus secretin PilQ [Rhodanobacteraceae bacterium]
MNTANARACLDGTRSNRVHARWVGMLLLLVATLVLAAPAYAQHTLKDLSYQVLPGGKVALSLHFDGAAPNPTAFTTDKPPRIALDFADTANTVSNRSVDIGTGATSGVTIVTSNGRTRVVIDLFRPATYRTNVKGDTLVVDVANGKESIGNSQSYAATDPTKAPPPSDVSVSNIDFRRGDNGAGKIIIDFSGPGANADMQRKDDQIKVNLGQVRLPGKFAKHLDVTDFATPVRFIETRAVPGGASMQIAASGNIETSAYQTGTQYVVTVEPKTAPKKKEPELGADGRPKAVYTGDRVTFNFQDIPVRQVLHLIASESNFNLVVADSVGGQVTLRLVNVPWDQALDIVLRAKGLDKRKEGNVIWVAPQKEIADREQAIAEARQQQEQNAELISAYIPISYGKAADIAKLMTEGSMKGGGGGGGKGAQTRGFLSPRGSVSFDQRTNTLLVNDTPDKVNQVRALVAKLDKPVEQVLIESRIVVATDDYARDLGVKFGVSGGYEDKNGNVITTSGSLNATDGMVNQALVNRFNNTGSGLPVVTPTNTPSLGDRLNVNLPAATKAGSFGLAILGADYLLDLELSAAQTEGKSEIISSPRVITANQQQATISQGQQIGYQTVTSSGAGGGALPQVQFKDVTLKLEVTPTITADGRVFLNLNVHKDSLAGYYQGPTGQIPIIDTRQIQTSVLVDNGATVVLGGILEINKTDNLTKVPFLGDIPGVGALFRNKSKKSNHAELLVFVTPRILDQKLN